MTARQMAELTSMIANKFERINNTINSTRIAILRLEEVIIKLCSLIKKNE